MQQNKETILANNRNLAEQNLILQPRLDHQKNELTKRYRCLQEQFEAFQLRKSTLGDVTPSGYKKNYFLFSVSSSHSLGVLGSSLTQCVNVYLSGAFSCHPSVFFHLLLCRFSDCFFSRPKSQNKPTPNKAHHQKLGTGSKCAKVFKKQWNRITSLLGLQSQ